MTKAIAMPNKMVDTMVGELQRKHAAGELSAETVVKCEAIPGWDWQPEPKHKNFESFIAHQRKRYVRGTLPAWKRQRLEAIPGWSW